MGTFCSRQTAAESIVPDTDTMKGRSQKVAPPNNINIKDSSMSDITASGKEGNIGDDALFDEFRDAIQDGNDTMVHFYMEEYSSMDLLNLKYRNKDTVLNRAVQNQKYTVVDILLKEGASINKQNSLNGDTALHIAAANGDIRMIKLLLKYNGNPNICNHDDETAISIAEEHNYTEIIKILRTVCNNESENLELKNDLSPKVFAEKLKIQHHARMRTSKVNYFVDDVLFHTKSIAANTTPQPINRFGTVKLLNIASDVYNDVLTTVRHNKEHLPVLQGWLYKKELHFPYSWLRRWVIVKQGYVLWSDREMTIENKINKNEKLRWNKCIYLSKIRNVSTVLHKSQKRFRVCMKKRDYIFKTKSTKIRDKWIEGMNKHIEVAKLESVYTVDEKKSM